MGPRRQGQILVLSRRVPPGSRLWLDFQASVSLQDVGFGYVSVPRKNPRVKETHMGFSGKVIFNAF